MSTESEPSSARLAHLASYRWIHSRALTVWSVLVLSATGLSVTDAVPALAKSLDPTPSEAAKEGPTHLDAVQSYKVSVSVDTAVPQRTTEIEIVPTAWTTPAIGELRDGFGPRPLAPVAGVSGFHSGQDVAAPCRA